MISEHTRTYWKYEYDVSERFMVPLLNEWRVPLSGAKVLDVGCGEGGGLCSLHDRGAICRGMDLEEHRIAAAEELKGERSIQFHVGDIYREDTPFFDSRYDLLVLHDVFEHLDQKVAVLRKLGAVLRSPHARILLTFPPYYSAYGAHQQLLRSWYLRLPFLHLLPLGMSEILPRAKGEDPYFVEEVKKLGRLKMGMSSFERIVESAGMKVAGRQAYIVGPNHIRFGLKPLPAGPLAAVPLLREVVCTGVVYLLAPDA